MNSKHTSNTKITFFRHINEVDKPSYVSLSKALQMIREGGSIKPLVEQIRSSNDEAEIRELKKKLPCVLFSGVFNIPIKKQRADNTYYESYRTDESLSIHSRFIPFDIDDIDEVEKYKNDAHKDEYIYALWVSPSGKGLHGLIKIADGNKHDQHYNALLKRYPMFDTTARNPSRVLYASYDPTIYINEDSKTFFEVIETTRNEGMVMTGTRTDYSKLNIATRMIQNAEQGTRHNSVMRASYLVGGWVAGGLVEEHIARQILEFEVAKKFSNGELDIEIRGIADGIVRGQLAPINELEIQERDAIKELGIIDEELSFLANNQLDEEFMRRYRAGLIPMGLPFGYHDMDKYLLLKEGEFYATLSHSHTGKTTLNLWLFFLAAYQYDWGFVVYTGENRTASVKMRIIEFYVGKKIKEIPEYEFQDALKWTNERFFFVNNDSMYEYTDLLKYAESVSKYHSIKGIFIDPVNALKRDARVNRYDYDMEMYTDMLLFTKRTNISIFLSLHTRTQSQRERNKDGNQLMPFPADADGGAILYNKVDIFVTMNRDIQDRERYMYTEIYVNKMRNKETGGDVTPKGNPIVLRFDWGIEFVDLHNHMPIKRKKLVQPIIEFTPPTEEDINQALDEIPF